MRHITTRYGSTEAFNHYAMGMGTVAELARFLKRDQRTVRDWLSGRQAVPWWTPELLRLHWVEKNLQARQMGLGWPRAQLVAIGAATQPAERPSAARPLISVSGTVR